MTMHNVWCVGLFMLLGFINNIMLIKTTTTCGISVVVGCVGFVLSWLCVYVGAVLWF